MISSTGKLHTTIRLTVVVVFLLATTLTAALAIGLQYHFGKGIAKESATRLYSATASAISEKIAHVGQVNTNVIDLLAANRALATGDEYSGRLPAFTAVLEKNPLFYGIYLGRADGSFFEVINLDSSDDTRQAMGALAEDRWLVIEIAGDSQPRQRIYHYLDGDLRERLTRSEAADYEVTGRPWYTGAMATDGVSRTEPYLFAQLGIPGITLSRRVGNTDTVVAIDMTLQSMSDFLRHNAIGDQADAYLFSGEGEVIASSRPTDLRADAAPDSGGQRPAMGRVPDPALIDLAADHSSHGELRASTASGRDWLAYVAPAGTLHEKTLYLGIRAPLAALMAPQLEKVKTSSAVTAGFMLLLVPLSWVFANPIVRPVRQLAAENDKVRRRAYAEVQRVPSRVKELDELSESMVNMVAAIQAHELAQRNLMDSFIKLIAEAIDDKSSYTGGHCERVPVLAMMLAEHASDSRLPAFADFSLDTEDQRREYQIAAWLHDCGKITTPEHIVDKGSKLEVIYNRIHEIRTRFEVLWRDAEITYWQSLAASGDTEPALRAALERERQQLRSDFAFVAQCNVGGEYLDQDKQERLRTIARRTWMRYFDDRLGLAPQEELRQPRMQQELPVQEPLLGDRPWHIIERESPAVYPEALGIDMDIPQHLSNQGELYNLSVSRGTLTPEDRFRIKEHMISTIKMLERLPFPEELRNVPRYASTHHETLRGDGYPRRLPGAALSIPERILAVADIFEALTASDRPYKKGKPLSAAIEIMHRMVLDGHIDGDCFELFLREGVYIQYAREFLTPEQIDEVTLERYLAG